MHMKALWKRAEILRFIKEYVQFFYVHQSSFSYAEEQACALS